jgi:hypothetical protein
MKGPTRAAAIAGVVLLALSAACGEKKVTVNVDVASFIAPEDRSGHYLAPPLSPPVEFELQPIAVDLVEGLNSFTVAEEMGMDVAVQFTNTSGEGRARFTVFFNDTEANLFDTAPVTSLEADLVAGQTTTGTSHFDADERVLALFRQEQVMMGLLMHWTPGSPEALDGDYTITQIDARVVTSVQIF